MANQFPCACRQEVRAASLTKPMAVFACRNKRFDHFRANVVSAELVQLVEPEVIPAEIERGFGARRKGLRQRDSQNIALAQTLG